MKQRLKRWLFALLGKDPEAVVVTFHTGDPALCARMEQEVRALLPDRRHFSATPENWPELRRELKCYRIGLVPVLITGRPHALRRAAFRIAPHKILAYNPRLERHHLGANLASVLFWCGVPLDRIHLRPWWWPWRKRELSVIPRTSRIAEGRPCTEGRRRIAVLSPYFPYPLAHGGAVRIYNLLREMSRDFDIALFAFEDSQPAAPVDPSPLLEFCARVILVEKPRYREPRWSTLLPPEVHEFRSPAMKRALIEVKRSFQYELLQVEYTQLAEYGGDVLVEHDVTFDLYNQIRLRQPRLLTWWDWYRWHRFETAEVRKRRRVVVMSEKDAEMLGPSVPTTVLENGVDLDRYQPQPEQPGRRLLFVGSFRHFPNINAYRFFTEKVWPTLRDQFPDLTLTAVCGPDHLAYWQSFAGTPEPPLDPRIHLFGFVSDVRPVYTETNLAIVPTTVSAGTNVKVLEAMAMERAVVSTTSGAAGLGLVHGETAWIADTPESFASGIATLIDDPARRAQIAQAAYFHARRKFDWQSIGERQNEMLHNL